MPISYRFIHSPSILWSKTSCIFMNFLRISDSRCRIYFLRRPSHDFVENKACSTILFSESLAEHILLFAYHQRLEMVIPMNASLIRINLSYIDGHYTVSRQQKRVKERVTGKQEDWKRRTFPHLLSFSQIFRPSSSIRHPAPLQLVDRARSWLCTDLSFPHFVHFVHKIVDLHIRRHELDKALEQSNLVSHAMMLVETLLCTFSNPSRDSSLNNDFTWVASFFIAPAPRFNDCPYSSEILVLGSFASS